MCHGIAEFSSKLKGQFIWEIFGDGDERKKIEDIITQSNLSDIVFLKGFSPSASEEIKNYDMLIIPSVNEAFGMVALEAAASGVYVVANAVGGISEAIGPKENGIVLPGHREISVFIAGLVEGGMKPVTSNNNSLSFWKERQDDWMEKHIKFIYNI
jgi:glycosyltransferase involved in cell wall biosynthesis